MSGTPQSYETLALRSADGVTVVTLNRPDRMNALSGQLLQDLVSLFRALRDDAALGAVVVTGSPASKRPAFAAGADIAEMSAMNGLQLRRYSQLGQSACRLIETLHVPVIAAINGFALGGGLELAMACHLRFAAKGAQLGQPEVNLGLIPGFGGTQRLPRLVGGGRALELLLSGEPIDADEAMRIGLVNHVVEPGALVDHVTAFAAKLAAKAPLARRFILESVGRGAALDPASSLELETDLFGLTGTTEDVKEGLAAFLAKRSAQWKGC